MLTILLISIFSNSFIILRFSRTNFYKLHRYEGQLLYIKAVFIGTFLTLFIFLIDSLTHIVEYLCKLLPDSSFQTNMNSPFDGLIGFLYLYPHQSPIEELFVLFCLTAVSAFLYCILGKVILFIRTIIWFRGDQTIPYLEQEKIILMYNILKDSPLDELFFSSYVDDKYLLITMSDRKAYVGRVINLGEPNEKEGPDQEIAIVPVYSGFRHKDNLSLSLTVSYKIYNDPENVPLVLVLKQDNIISACEFIFPLYKKFQKLKKSSLN